MSKICFFSLLFIFLLSLAASSLEIDLRAMDADTFYSYLRVKAREYQVKYRIPGASLAFISNGELKGVMGVGVMDRRGGEPITSTSLFQVASISKSVAALGVMKLVNDGLVRLEDPVSNYLTRWQLPDSSYSNEITIYHLLSHTGGLGPSGYPGYHPNRPLPSLEESLGGDGRGTLGVVVKGEPGKEFSYSGGGYTVMELLIEEVKGVPFHVFMEEEIFLPLGMEKSSFIYKEDDAGSISTPYSVFHQPLPNYLFAEQAAAGLYSTAEDLAIFLIALMNENPPIDSSLLDRMFTPVKGGYGLGFSIVEEGGEKVVAHGGSNHGWKSYMAMLPDRGDGIVILSNSDRGMPFYGDLANLFFSYHGLDYRVKTLGIFPLYFFHFYQRAVRLFL